MKHPAPGPALVRATADRYLSSVRRVERVHQGASTYVYRADTAQGIYYLRYLPARRWPIAFCWIMACRCPR